jgi:hypothetical protein
MTFQVIIQSVKKHLTGEHGAAHLEEQVGLLITVSQILPPFSSMWIDLEP